MITATGETAYYTSEHMGTDYPTLEQAIAAALIEDADPSSRKASGHILLYDGKVYMNQGYRQVLGGRIVGYILSGIFVSEAEYRLRKAQERHAEAEAHGMSDDDYAVYCHNRVWNDPGTQAAMNGDGITEYDFPQRRNR